MHRLSERVVIEESNFEVFYDSFEYNYLAVVSNEYIPGNQYELH